MSGLNTPCVFFAAERTLMAFGFVLERFGWFLHVLRQNRGPCQQRSFVLDRHRFQYPTLITIGFSIVQPQRAA